MKVETSRFGDLEVAQEDSIDFPKGLFGFEDVNRYVLLDHREGSPFKWLQAIGRPELAFVVMDPFLIRPGYRFDLSEEDSAALQHSRGVRLLVLVIVGIPEDPEEMTANLKGPVLINCDKGLGRQVILAGDEYPARLAIIDAIRGLDQTAALE